MKKLISIFSLLSITAAHSADLYVADFSVAGQGATHDNGADVLEPSPVDGENWMIFWDMNPGTDSSTNSFITVDGLLISDDWGGPASFETDTIDVTGQGTVNINAVAATRGEGVFNNVGTEQFAWYYMLDGVRTDGPIFTADGDLSYAASVDVSGASSLVVGFTFNINGSQDGFEISSLKVDDGVATPEISLELMPASFSENGGSSTATVTVSVAPGSDLVLDVALNDVTEANAPATVTILGGSLTADFTITGMNDLVSDGPQIVTLTVTDPGAVYREASTTFVVTDDEAFTPPNVRINEIRINAENTIAADGEYFELFSSQENVSLDRIFLVAIGDGSAAQGSGVVEEIVDLTGQTMNGNYFVGADTAQDFAMGDLTVDLNFEDENVTFLLVSDFAAVEGDDLDIDDDGTLDSMPWGTLLDGLSLVSSVDPSAADELVYAPTLSLPVVGPDGAFIPAHVFRPSSNPLAWQIGTFFPSTMPEEAQDSPGEANPTVDGVDPLDPKILAFNILNKSTGEAELIVSGLGEFVFQIQFSDDLNQNDIWEVLAAGFTESDNQDGSVTFTFTDPGLINRTERFYRIMATN